MINFFRHIRKKLPEDNKPFKYLRYAIGEVILIVFGILIALAINNWNEHRRDRIKERGILMEIAESLEINTKALIESIAVSKRNIEERSFYLALVQNRSPYNDSLQVHFRQMGLGFARTTISKSGYEMLKNEGFDLLESGPLKKELLNLFEVTFPGLESQESNSTLRLLDEEVLIYQRRNFRATEIGRIPLDYEELLNDHYFHEIIRSYRGRETMLINSKQKALEVNQRALKLIQVKLQEDT
jgi:hypothetical protein